MSLVGGLFLRKAVFWNEKRMAFPLKRGNTFRIGVPNLRKNKLLLEQVTISMYGTYPGVELTGPANAS